MDNLGDKEFEDFSEIVQNTLNALVDCADQHRPSIREDFGGAIIEYYTTIPRTEMFSVFFVKK